MNDTDRRDLFAAAAMMEMWAASANRLLAELKRRDAEAAVAAAPTEPDPGDGFRWVRFGEELCEGDLFDFIGTAYVVGYYSDIKLLEGKEVSGRGEIVWVPSHAMQDHKYRRRIEPAAPTTADAAVGRGSTERDRHCDAIGDEIPAEAVPSLLQAEIARLTAEVERLRAARTALTRALRVFLFEITSPTTDQSHEVRQAIADALRDGGTT